MFTNEPDSTATLTGTRPSGAEPTASFLAPVEPCSLPSGTGAETASFGASTIDSTDAPVPARPHVPGYALEEQLGVGGMGVVMRARDLTFDRPVAVKMLRDGHAPDSPAARRFIDEARITGQLQHPSIPPAHHLGTLPDGRPFLAMKLIKGTTLGELLRNDSDNHWQLIAVFAQVCQAVAYAHSRGVIHRDLKPSNVMVGAFGEVQVMDWGLAKVLGEEPAGTPADPVPDPLSDRTSIRIARAAGEATQDGCVLGTPAYMSPEQAAGLVDQVDERTDVFGLGAVLCAILTGAPPYSGATTEAVRAQAALWVTDEAFARLDACGRNPELTELCKRCLARVREHRPRDAGEVTQTLTAVLASAEQYARQAELERVRVANELARMTAAERARRKRRLPLAVLGVLVVGGGLLATYRIQSVKVGSRSGSAVNSWDVESPPLSASRRDWKDAARQVAKSDLVEYARSIEAAREELSNGNVEAARALLAQTAPELRGWEWEYLHRLGALDPLTLRGHTSAVESAAFGPGGKRIVTGSEDRTAWVWGADTGAEKLALKGHTMPVTSVAFSADGKRIVTGSGDRTARVWDADTGIEKLTLKGHTKAVYAVAFGPNGKRVATVSGDQTVKVWDADTGQEELTLQGHTGKVTSVCFSPDGKRIVTGSDDKTARVWDADTGREVLVLKGHTNAVTSVSFSPDGNRVVTASADKTARAWDATTGKGTVVLIGSPDELRSAAFGPEGRRIVTGGRDRATRIWDAGTGVLLLTLRNHTGAVTSVSFSPDGSRIVSASADGTTQVWDARPVLERAPPPREVKRPDAP